MLKRGCSSRLPGHLDALRRWRPAVCWIMQLKQHETDQHPETTSRFVGSPACCLHPHVLGLRAAYHIVEIRNCMVRRFMYGGLDCIGQKPEGLCIHCERAHVHHELPPVVLPEDPLQVRDPIIGSWIHEGKYAVVVTARGVVDELLCQRLLTLLTCLGCCLCQHSMLLVKNRLRRPGSN